MKQSHPVDPRIDEKIDRFRYYWNLEAVNRPILAFDIGGFFPLSRFDVPVESGEAISVDVINPESFVQNFVRFLEASLEVDDDAVRGVCPISAIPWIEAMLGSTPRLGGDSIWAEGLHLQWEALGTATKLTPDNSWLRKYLQFVEVLQREFAGICPVSQPILRGLTDLMGTLRGHSESVIDCIDEPDLVHPILDQCADAFITVIQEQDKLLDPFHGGYFLEQYSIWAPGRLLRIQEDVSALYSPSLFDEFILPRVRRISSQWPYVLVHLHPPSLFLLDSLLGIDSIGVYQINKDVGGTEIPEMMDSLVKVQKSGKRLLLRGPLTIDDLGAIRENLEPEGLMIQVVIDGAASAAQFSVAALALW